MKMRSALPLFGALLLVSLPLTAPGDEGGTQRLSDLRGIWNVEFNPDGSRLVVRMTDAHSTIWDTDKGTLIGDVPPEPRAVKMSVTSPDGTMVFEENEENARVLDAASGAAVSPVMDLHDRPLFSPNNEFLVACGEKEASVWKVRSGEKIATLPLPTKSEEASQDNAPSVLFTEDSAACFLHDGRGTVTKFDTKNWKPLGKPMKHPPADSAYDFYFDISEDGKWVVTSDTPGENGPKAHLQIWDGLTTKPIGPPLVSRNGFAKRFISGTNRIVIGPADGDTTVRELPSMKTLFKFPKEPGSDEPDFDITPDGKWIIAWSVEDFIIHLYGSASGQPAERTSNYTRVLKVYLAPDSSAAYVVFDNSTFSSQGYEDYYVMKFSIPELKITQSIRLAESVESATLSPDGRRLAILQGEPEKRHVQVLDTATMKPLGSAKD